MFSWLTIKSHHQNHLISALSPVNREGELTPNKFDRLLFFLLCVGVVLGVEKSSPESADCSCNKRPTMSSTLAPTPQAQNFRRSPLTSDHSINAASTVHK